MMRILVVLSFFLATSVLATPVGPMSYQGRLLDDSGVPVTGAYDFKINIHNDPATSSLQYYEEHLNVQVDDGVYSFKVGTGTNVSGPEAWDTNLWQGNLNDLYLELEVSPYNANTYEALTPRHELTSAPHAFTATLALALGNKTAEEYDNILEGVCVASKGKWLELVDKCLGAGASFPGPFVASWNTLTATNDFTNLDLSNSDITGISFSTPTGANLTGTLFNKTTYKTASFINANIVDTQWDGAIATDTSASLFQSSAFNIQGATFKNMDMSKWHFQLFGAGAGYKGLSAAYLTACPVLTAQHGWECRLMHSSGSEYFLAGYGANLSNSSALAISGLNGAVLDIDSDALNGISLVEASFVGSTIQANLEGCSLYNADMSYSVIKNAHFKNGTSFTGTNFTGARIEQSVFEAGTSISADFINAELNNVIFLDDVSTADFTGAFLREVDFNSVAFSDFTGATFEDVRIQSMLSTSASPYYTTFDKTRFYGLFYVADHYGGYPNFDHLIYRDLEFYGATLSGDFADVTFTNSISFVHTALDDLNLNNAVIPLVDGTAPHDDLSTVKWGEVRCPDGTVVTGGTGIDSCDYLDRMTP